MMYSSVDDISAFYRSEIGGIVQNVISRHIAARWSDVHGFRVLGCGYTSPYLRVFQGEAERVLSATSIQQGVEYWPEGGKNLSFTFAEGLLPIENASIDRILLVHHLEYSENFSLSFNEIWRVLKANGRVLIVVPNRVGLWARADWSPFGRGQPFTLSQLITCLSEHRFVHEVHHGVLFVPPLPDSPVMMRSANLIERMGQSVFPFVAGLHIVEVSKQIYARDKTGGGSTVLAKTKEILGARPKPVSQRSRGDL